MSKYIKDHTLSIGFNPLLGQEFFNTLFLYEKYIHSYFFSLSLNVDSKFNCVHTDPKDIADMLSKCETHNIPANILFNSNLESDKKSCIDYIEMVRNIPSVNLKAVTCLSLDMALAIKKKYPDMEIHLSVRFFDWYAEQIIINGGEATIDHIKKIIYKRLDELIAFNQKHNHVVDVVNISGAYSFNDFELIKKAKSTGLTTKIILNEACIGNRWFNFKNWDESFNQYCFGDNCGKCVTTEQKYPWCRITRDEIYKELFKYYENIDIFKLSSRGISKERLNEFLSYYTSDEPTHKLFLTNECQKNMYLYDNAYNIFLEYIDMISSCSRNCYTCQRCKIVYEKLMKENGLL